MENIACNTEVNILYVETIPEFNTTLSNHHVHNLIEHVHCIRCCSLSFFHQLTLLESCSVDVVWDNETCISYIEAGWRLFLQYIRWDAIASLNVDWTHFIMKLVRSVIFVFCTKSSLLWWRTASFDMWWSWQGLETFVLSQQWCTSSQAFMKSLSNRILWLWEHTLADFGSCFWWSN